MQGATRIDVRQARKSADVPTNDILIDQVRGVIAAHPAKDLVLLSVNPRFATRFQDLSLARQDQIVSSQYLIQCLPPTNRFPWPTVETRVIRRATRTDLPETLPAALEAMGLTADDVRWIQHRQSADLRAGAPLVADDGTLLAINTSPPEPRSQELLAIPASHVTMLLKQGGSESRPLPLPVVGVRPETADNIADAADDRFLDESEMSVVDRTSRLRSLSEKLNIDGDRCQRFGWWPDNASQAEQLQEFAKSLLQASGQRQLADSERDQAVITRQITDWTDHLTFQLNRIATENAINPSEFNRHFPTQLRLAGGTFIGVVKVIHSAMESPTARISTEQAGDTIGLEFAGTGERMIANLSIDWPPMRPDSLWLVVGQRLPGHINLLDRNQQRARFLKVEIQFVFPIETR